MVFEFKNIFAKTYLFRVKAAGLTYQNMFEELPIIIKSSYLNNVLMSELSLAKSCSSDKYSTRHFDLGSKKSLEKSVRAMMANVDELNKSIQSLTKYTIDKQRHDNMVFSLTQKRVRISNFEIKNILIVSLKFIFRSVTAFKPKVLFFENHFPTYRGSTNYKTGCEGYIFGGIKVPFTIFEKKISIIKNLYFSNFSNRRTNHVWPVVIQQFQWMTSRESRLHNSKQEMDFWMSFSPVLTPTLSLTSRRL